MHSQPWTPSRMLGLRIDPGEDVLRSLRTAVQEHGIADAAILGGVGSLDRYRFHVVETTNLPPGDTFVQGDGSFDILTVTGLVIGGRVHAHITFSNTQVAMGGHLEEGCRVLTFCIIQLAETPGADFAGWDTPGPLR